MLSNEALLTRLHESRAREKELVVVILNDLLEVEKRGLYLARGYSSMFKFCIEALGYSEAEAMVRLNAMRLMRSVPEVAEKIETGSLSLTNAAEVGRQIRREEVRRKNPLSRKEKLSLVESVENLSTRECERRLARALPEIQEVVKERTQVLRDEKTLIQFVAGPELMGKIERLKELLSHKNFEGRFDVLFEEVCDIALKKLEPKTNDARLPGARKVSAEPAHGSNAPLPGAPKVSRYIPVRIKREVFKRAGWQCEYRDPLTGRRCTSRHGLELDHIIRIRDGGTNDIQNLRVYCDAHNRGRERFPCFVKERQEAYCA